MSLVGSLEDLTLLDILQIVNVARRTGVLRLHTPQIPEAFIHFSGGNVADIVGQFAEEPFLEFFRAQGLVDPKELAEARQRAGSRPEAILRRLLETGALNRRLVDQARRLELAQRLKLLTQQSSGEFSFALTEAGEQAEAGTVAPFSPLSQPVSPQNLLMETFAEAGLADWSSQRRVERPEEPQPPPAAVKTGVASPAEALFPPAEAPPAAPAPPPAPAPSQLPAPAAYRGPSPHPVRSKVTVLLASDESIFKGLLRKRLMRHFQEVAPVSDLQSFLAQCASFLADRRPFLAVVDLLMPTADGQGYLGGMELLEEASRRHPEVKLLLMSDLSDERILDLARLKGAVSILLKPPLHQVKVDQLEESLDAFAESLCAEVDRLLPQVEEEVATFYKDLGVETVSEGYRVRDQLTLLKGLMGELASPRESSEISLLVLRLAAEYFERAVLFLVKKEELLGLGGFGETGDTEMMMQKVRRLRVPLGAGSIFDDTIRSRSTAVRDAASFSGVDRDFAQALGTRTPKQTVAIPMISRGRVVAILYADNAISADPLPELSGIEIFMAQAGLAMEKALLERQLLSLRRSIPNQLGGRGED
jgi:CheY-like chemotaxis protein